MNTNVVELTANGINIEINGLVAGAVKIPSDYVSYNFAPILGTHLLITGDRLANGMLVVVEDNLFRENPNKLSPEYGDRKNGFVPSEYDRARIEETSRWALVTDFVKRGEIINFTAIYADGTMRSRQYNQSIKWAVLTEFEIAPVCPACGTVHATEGSEKPENDSNPWGQPPYGSDVSQEELDKFAREVSSIFLGQELGYEEFLALVKEKVAAYVEQFIQDIESEEPPAWFENIMDVISGLFGAPSEPDVAEASPSSYFADIFNSFNNLVAEDYATQPGTSIVDDSDQATYSDNDEVLLDDGDEAESKLNKGVVTGEEDFQSNITFESDVTKENPTGSGAPEPTVEISPAPSINVEQTQPKLSDDEALAALRAKLRGEIVTSN